MDILLQMCTMLWNRSGPTTQKEVKMATCPVCDGSGDCKNDFHAGFLGNLDPQTLVEELLDVTCPACGGGPNDPRNCSTCGGSGEVDDDY